MSDVLLVNDDTMLARLEKDLTDKATAAFADAAVDSMVYGVFSLDDLENKQESDLSRRIGVGIAYNGTTDLAIDFNSNKSPSPSGGQAVKMLSYSFLLILAVPTGPECTERYNATQLLTVLRRRVHGSKVSGDPVSRAWNFAAEKPEPGASTETMLYYTQTWKISLPLAGL